jgi:hypothetical protein
VILGQVFTRYHLRRTIPALAEPEDPVTCVSSPQARSRKPFETGDPSILAVGYGKKIELLSSDPLCEMEFYRRFLYHYPRDPDHGVAEKSSLRVDSNVLSLECFPDSWLLAYGLRNGDIGIHDYRLPPDARLGWLRHPSSVTGLRKLRGNEIIACGPQHAVGYPFDVIPFPLTAEMLALQIRSSILSHPSQKQSHHPYPCLRSPERVPDRSRIRRRRRLWNCSGR